ncbi:MAG: hypothetical protein KGL69_03015 [Alphaproteobacteria bacterium]|jgi:hypothetical protein|nr:hypothetical protein [Alphaproteobacteria bacterium]
MKAWIGGVAGGSFLAMMVTGCTPPHLHHHDAREPKAVSTLDCPNQQGDLKLRSKSPDGRACAYGDDEGNQVNLSLLPVANGEADVALKPIVASLTSQLPPLPPKTAASTRDETADWNDGSGSDVNIPGVHVHKGANGRADVDIAGVHIHAVQGDGDSEDQANIQIGGGGAGHEQVLVQARDGGAQVIVSGGGPGVRRVFILASDKPGPNGYRLAGYVARGPDSGPLVVAQMLSKARHADPLRDDARDLVRLNTEG